MRQHRMFDFDEAVWHLDRREVLGHLLTLSGGGRVNLSCFTTWKVQQLP